MDLCEEVEEFWDSLYEVPLSLTMGPFKLLECSLKYLEEVCCLVFWHNTLMDLTCREDIKSSRITHCYALIYPRRWLDPVVKGKIVPGTVQFFYQRVCRCYNPSLKLQILEACWYQVTLPFFSLWWPCQMNVRARPLIYVKQILTSKVDLVKECRNPDCQ